jgi:phosphoglucosamine mutase
MTTKKLFGETDGIRARANSYPMDVNTMLNIGRALGEYVKLTVKKNPNRPYKVIIGKDTRRSGYMIEQAITAGFLSRGVDVMTIGPVPTPSLSRLVRSFALDLGVQITASHNPFYDNGVKLFNKDGIKLSDEEELAIEKLFFEDHFADIEEIGRAKRIEDVTGRYIEFVKSASDNVSLKGLKIVVDCANGAAYKTAPTVFEELGAEVIKIGVEPNGYNINEGCGALHPEKVREEVLKHKADLGIALDGDADRVHMVDEVGHIIDGDYIIALLAKTFDAENRLNQHTVAITQYSNLALIEYLKKFNIKADNSVVNGDRALAVLCNKAGYNFAGEQTGHYIMFDYADTGDGTLSALLVMKVIKDTGKKLSELAYTFEKYPQEKFQINVKDKKPLESIPELMELDKKWKAKFGEKGRTLLRYSGTENILRIMIEVNDKKVLDEAMAEYKEVAKKIFS